MKLRLFLVTFVILVASSVPSWSSWQGSEIDVDGAPHVINPEAPIGAVRVELRELWERGGEDDDIFFGRVGQLLEDETGELYVLDSQLSEIHAFSPDGELLRTIGREGEGPGEFMQTTDMYLGPDGLLGLVRIFPGRIYRIGRDGSPAMHFPLPDPGGFQLVHIVRATNDHIVVAGSIQTRVDGKQIETSYLKAFDAAGKELAHYCDLAEETRFGGMQFDEKTFTDFMRRWALAPDGRVAVAMSFDDYRIDIYKADGSLDRVIERPDHVLLERSGSEKTRLQEFYDGITSWSPNSSFQVSDTHQAVGRLWFRDNGNLWVLPSQGSWGAGEGIFASIDEYDAAGRYLRRIDLIMEGEAVEDGLFIIGDRIYRVSDLFNAIMASLGGGADDESDDTLDMDPLRIIAYELNISER